MIDFRGYPDFATASHAVLALLRDRIGFDLWMVTRVSGHDWVVLQAEDHGYGVEPGTVFQWADSFCSEMIKGKGPFIATDSDLVAAYKNAPINQKFKVAAYIGLPLCDKDGNLFGTLCGIHPTTFPDSLQDDLPLLELIARLLGSLLDAELKSQQARRSAERAAWEAQTDTLTGLYNRRGWEKLLQLEETRCQQLGCAASVIVIDLDDLKKINDQFGHTCGDQHLQQFTAAIEPVLRPSDVAARTGGDEFAILGVEMDHEAVRSYVEQLQETLTRSEIRASIGYAVRHPHQGLMAAWHEADLAMYRHKQQRKLEQAALSCPLPSG
ncbi:sensor domain-containing diguanylate cyclase [Leptolyngbya iicbica]|uniref:Sensor domain-containing diguanylate cyclase n=2 Tax=Cyanophyceae TaxID=3028117 RepID=A0A4Q7E2V8_9CYAN|nr:sensor domain-containing diguanylate cyclase [Leptolyngbya sp. LK]RZM76016.1 sensor domain-containing diguanylate cyclase [Leptolyngbya sp. LK]